MTQNLKYRFRTTLANGLATVDTSSLRTPRFMLSKSAAHASLILQQAMLCANHPAHIKPLNWGFASTNTRSTTMDQQEFLLQLKALRAKYDVQLLTGIEYNRELLRVHADHASAMLVPVEAPKPTPVLPRGLTYAHTEWAGQHDWYVSRGLDDNGYFVVVRPDSTDGGLDQTFRDYNELRAWAGY